MDNRTSAQRSSTMARIGSRDTTPELRVRRFLFSRGYRYTTHNRSLPGQPDIVFSRRRKVVFVHGCFWHSHPGCANSKIPTTRRSFWSAKFRRNVERDADNIAKLLVLGWQSFVVWECQVCEESYMRALLRFIGKPIAPRVFCKPRELRSVT